MNMRAVVQRVQDCTVSVEGRLCGQVKKGLLVYLGVTHDDAEEDIEYIADKVEHLRIFSDPEGKLNLSVKDVGGNICVVSQFTLYGDARKGRRPSWDAAARPEQARECYEGLCGRLEKGGFPVQRGVFQAHMAVAYTNDGPVTMLLDSKKAF
jgi:D-tyrosyl-tRNA(Tyr) deacylase